jgi:glycosyltransferase involved in cell wall biosynthesis
MGLRIAVDARVPDAQWGGVQHVITGLATGLGHDDDGDDEFLFLAYSGESAWLEPHLAANSRLVEVPGGTGKTKRRRAFERVAKSAPRVAALAQRTAPFLGRMAAPIPRSDGILESLGVDLIHFTTQQAFVTPVPSIYQPHDLQHVHLPGNFSRLQLRYRDAAYRTFCEQARLVVVMTNWGREDLCTEFQVPRDKVAVVPWAPVANLQSDASVGNERDLPPRFLLYPAQTWPHKNHVRLIEAIASLREKDLRVTLLCTGQHTQHYGALKRRVEELGLSEQILFLGYVDAATLAAMYRRATALVFPSRFEGWGLPVVEAFAFGLPVVASNATVLPEVAGGAALLFDPHDTRSMADAIARVWQDEPLRSSLRGRGLIRAADLSWDRTARTFRALYRKVARVALSDEDRALLAPPTLIA